MVNWTFHSFKGGTVTDAIILISPTPTYFVHVILLHVQPESSSLVRFSSIWRWLVHEFRTMRHFQGKQSDLHIVKKYNIFFSRFSCLYPSKKQEMKDMVAHLWQFENHSEVFWLSVTWFNLLLRLSIVAFHVREGCNLNKTLKHQDVV